MKYFSKYYKVGESKKLIVFISMLLVLSNATSVLASTVEETTLGVEQSIEDPYNPSSIIDVHTPDETFEETIFVPPSIDSTNNLVINNGSVGSEPIMPYVNDPGGGCCASYFTANSIDLYNIPLEYKVYKGNLVIFQRPGLYYYKQNAEQGWFNLGSAYAARTISQGLGIFATWKVVKYVPYAARFFDKYGAPKPYNWQDYSVTAASLAAQYNTPFWGKIMFSGIPSYGTKEVLVYVSTTGKSYSWHRRVLFTLRPDGSLTISKKYVY